MRRSAWIVPLLGVVPWLLAVVVPLVFGARAVLDRTGEDIETHSLTSLFITTLAWALGIAFVSMLIGWPPGRALGKLRGRRSFAPAMALLLAPICLPAYVVFWFWWQLWPPESAIYRFAVEHDLIRLVRLTTLAAGLVCWSWPIVAWCVAGMSNLAPVQREELLALDGGSFRERLMLRWRSDSRGLLVGGLIVMLATFMNTTCFDLSEVFTFSNEVRAIQALGASPGQVIEVSLPVVFMAFFGAVFLWLSLKPKAVEVNRFPRRVGVVPALFTFALWSAALLVPLVLFVRNIRWPDDFNDFTTLYTRSVTHTLGMALTVGALGAFVAAGFVLLALSRSRLATLLASVLAIGWVFTAATPGVTLASAFTAAYNQPVELLGSQTLADIAYTTPIALAIALLARFAFIAALIGRAAGLSEPNALRDLRSLDNANSLKGLWTTARPRIIAATAASFLIIGALTMSELVVTSQIYPPGLDPIGPVILSAMHYQQPETVMLAAIGLVAIALLAAIGVGIIWLRLSPRRAPLAALVLLALCMVLPGCARDDTKPDQLVPALRTFGSPGIALGQFSYPRAIAADCKNKYIYVIDKTARVQRFGFDGEPQLFWNMPAKSNGKPTGVSVAPDGRIFVADTHYFRVVVYDNEGHELQQFGSYGEEPGQFIYTTDIAFAPNGNLYVSEYGGHDRIQVFDADGKYLFEFGSPGSEPGQFTRPQSLAFSNDGTELFVADACNHRIQVFTLDGTFKRIISKLGRGLGEVAYPYGIIVLADDSLLVNEFGNNRVQRFSADGEPLGLWGTSGRGPGQLQYPWSSAVCDGELFILDSGNNRVQVMEAPG